MILPIFTNPSAFVQQMRYGPIRIRKLQVSELEYVHLCDY